MTDADRARAARRFADILADLLREVSDDPTHFTTRTTVGVERHGHERTWTFEDGLMVEDRFESDANAVIEARRLAEALADRILATSNPQDFTVSIVHGLCQRVGLVADLREDDATPLNSMWGPTLRFEVEP
jgi:hypothetical protein